MEDYDAIDNDQKQVLKEQLMEKALSLGCKNHFLSLIESTRSSSLNPLISKHASFQPNKSFINWKKVINKDKVNFLMEIIQDGVHNLNLISKKGHPRYKVIKILLEQLVQLDFK
tara:strand:+ start:591 stop:932 length:342 start_codon:yes stop_codon:yes gene_type:complete